MLPNPLTILLPGDIPMEFRLIPKGVARLGWRRIGSDQEPLCRMMIAGDFYLGTYPVTQRQFEGWTKTDDYRRWFKKYRQNIRQSSFTDTAEAHYNESSGKPNHPAEIVSWWEAQGFAVWLTAQVQGQAGHVELAPPWQARLPTEAEWEYACRAGTDTQYWSGDGEAALASVAWYSENSDQQTHPVGEKPANAYGLHDMHGNVWEWCLDAYQQDRYRTCVDGTLDTSDQTNLTAQARVLRGGSWRGHSYDCFSAKRLWFSDKFTLRSGRGNFVGGVGFRLAWVRGSGSSSVDAESPEQVRGAGRLQNKSGEGVRSEKNEAGNQIKGRGMSGVQKHIDEKIALSSEDGKAWHDPSARFLWPLQPDERVVKIVLGKLDATIALDASWLGGFRELRVHFPRLTHLHLWGLDNLEEVDGLPEGLEYLDIRNCPSLKRVGRIPDQAPLDSLDLGNCPLLTALPEGLCPDEDAIPQGYTSSLRYVWLDGCSRLRSFGPLKPALSGLSRLELRGCRFTDLDVALCGEQGENVAAAVRAHFRGLEEQTSAVLSECKVVILGNGGVGKTELVRALKGLPFNEMQTATEGIHLWHWDADRFKPFPDAGVNAVDVHIWDFGGQAIYDNTHRLFLENSVFIVAWRQARTDGKPFRENFPDDPRRPLNYWLDQVFSINPNARVLLVRTQMDRDDVDPPEDWRSQVREEYRQLPDFVVSAKRLEGQFDELKTRLRKEIKSELGGAAAVWVPLGRSRVRQKLAEWQPSSDGASVNERSAKPVIRLHEFIDLMAREYQALGLAPPDEQEARYTLDYFHKRGIVFAPRTMLEQGSRDAQLASPIVVDQRWVIDGIYSILQKSSREQWLVWQGRLLLDDLAQAWNEFKDPSGMPLFDAQTQWTMRQFMLRIGLLAKRGETLLLPEFLPELATLRRLPLSRDVVARTDENPARPSRTWQLTDRSLGQGFGCLLVVELLKHFDANSQFFRYGVLGSLDVWRDGKRDRKKAATVDIRIAWRELDSSAFQGSIGLTIVGAPEYDQDVLRTVTAWLQAIPGFPHDAAFDLTSGSASAWWEATRQRSLGSLHAQLAQEPMRAMSEVKPKPSLPRVGLSAAGEDENHPEIELWPRAIERVLARDYADQLSVLYYKSDREQRTVSELISHLRGSTLMLAFVGKKYLGSAYCMVELLKGAKRWQPNQTFSQPQDWLQPLWILKLPCSTPFLGKTDRGTPDEHRIREEWVKEQMQLGHNYWSQVLAEYEGELAAKEQAEGKYTYHDWRRFALESKRNLTDVLAAISNYRVELTWSRLEAPPADLRGPALEAWADEKIKPFVEVVAQHLRAAQSKSIAEKDMELRQLILRRWARGEHDEAASDLDAWLKAHNDPQTARAEAQQHRPPKGLLSELSSDDKETMKKVLIYWNGRSGRGNA